MLWLALNAATLLHYPTVLSDESLVGLVAYRLTSAGQLPGVSHFDPFGVYPFRLYLVGLAQWFNLFGLGLVQARSFSLFGGFLAGWLIFNLGRQLYDSQVGLLAAAIFWFMPHMFWTSHFVRPEMWVAVANLSLISAGWWMVRNPSRGRAWLIGFLSVAILDVYLSALATTLTIVALAVLCLVRGRQWSMLCLFIGGALTGVVYYAIVQFAPNWQTTLTNWQNWLALTGHAGPQLNLFQRAWALPEVLFRLFVRYSIIGWLEAVYFFIAILILGYRRRPADLYVLGAAGLAFAVFGVAFASPWHALDALPMPVLAVAAALSTAAKRFASWLKPPWTNWLPRANQGGVIATFLIAPLLAGYVGLSLYYGRVNSSYDYFAYLTDLQHFSRPQASILAEGTWWWGFTNQPYWWDETLEAPLPLTAEDAQSLVERTMHDQKITAVFVDENLGLETQPSSNLITRTALANYLANHCELRGTVARIAFGIDFNGPGIKQTHVYECPLTR